MGIAVVTVWLCQAEPVPLAQPVVVTNSNHHTMSYCRIPAPDPIPAQGGSTPPPTDVHVYK